MKRFQLHLMEDLSRRKTIKAHHLMKATRSPMPVKHSPELHRKPLSNPGAKCPPRRRPSLRFHDPEWVNVTRFQPKL